MFHLSLRRFSIHHSAKKSLDLFATSVEFLDICTNCESVERTKLSIGVFIPLLTAVPVLPVLSRTELVVSSDEVPSNPIAMGNFAIVTASQLYDCWAITVYSLASMFSNKKPHFYINQIYL